MANLPEGTGALQFYTATDPAAGTYAELTPPARTRWRILSLGMTIQTSATVTNRTANLMIYSGIKIAFRIGTTVTQSASNSLLYFFQTGYPFDLQPIASFVASSLPSPMFLDANYIIRFACANMQPTDQIREATAFVEEWIEP